MIRSFCLFFIGVFSCQPSFAQPFFPGPFVSPGSSFVEDFEAGTANFGRSEDTTLEDVTGDADVFTSGGGVGGSQQLQTVSSLDAVNAFQGVLFRAEGALGSSGLAFAGDYLAAGIDAFSFTVQHDAPVELAFGIRFAPFPANFPGGFVVGFDDVAPNTLTELAIEISPDNLFNPPFSFEGLAFFEQPTVDPLAQFNTIFSNIGNIQFTVELPAGFAAITQEDIDSGSAPVNAALGDVFALDGGDAFTGDALFNTADNITFGLDNVTITAAVPEPASASLLALCGLGAACLCRRDQ